MSGWSEARSILCVRLDAAGDVLMTTPALRAVKQSLNDSRITLMSSRSGVDIGRFVPEIDHILEFDAPWLKATSLRPTGKDDRDFIRELREYNFDAAIIFTVFSQNPLPAAYMCYLADIPLRLAHCRENPYQLLTHWIHESEPADGIRHEVQRQLDLVSHIGCRTDQVGMSFEVPDVSLVNVLERLRSTGCDIERPWAVLHPGATAPSRRYPATHYAHVADGLHSHNVQVVFTGSRDEVALVDKVQGLMRTPSVSLAGQLDLAELGALLSKASVVVTNNTGPAHIAAAVGAPLVDLYALTNPQHTPWGTRHRVLSYDVDCKYCFKSICPELHHDCLQRIEPKQVIEAALELMGADQLLAKVS